jgi:iron complex transport system permease protein
MLILTLLLILAVIISLGVGAVSLTPSQVLAALSGYPERESHAAIIRDLRLARVLLVAVCGGALAAAGAGFQGLFRNPLAEPYVVGASSGAALGATLSIIFSRSTGVTIPTGAAGFVGALVAVLVVYMLAESSNMSSMTTLLLVGAAVSTMLSALVSLLMLLNDQALQIIFVWLLGGFSGRSWTHLASTTLIALPAVIILWLMARPLDALNGGEETAAALGLNLRWIRLIIIAAASLATAAAVSVSGIIGFVGLIAPHLARLLVGAGHARLIPASILIGSLLLLLADGLARTIAAPVELPVGVFTALLGGPCFLVLMRAYGGSR